MKTQALDNRQLRKGIYRHYKGKEYAVIDTVLHSETHALMVLYKPLYGEGRLWVRPYDMFNELIQVNDQIRARFEFVSEHDLPQK